MEKWLEIRTAYHVAKHGTVSAAAKELGVHRSTVNRHIDALEAELGTKLFQRHSRGYVLTEAGGKLLTVATRVEEMLVDFTGRTRASDAELTGEIIVTTIPPVVDLLMPSIRDFMEQHPKTRIILQAQDDLLKLEYGEAHIALRAGTKPEQDDYVVQKLQSLELTLYAQKRYVQRKGLPKDISEFSQHDFVASPKTRNPLPVEVWLMENVPAERIVVHTSHPRITRRVVLAGLGIGILPVANAQMLPDLHQVMPPRPEWSFPLWLVTHVDLHRTEKVQTMLTHIKAHYGRAIS
ncbi:MAG: LysR family transcriptional regulator [Pseudomonadota bacterium]